MNFLITGGTGFIGGKLKNHLIKKGHHVFILTRSAEKYNNTDSETYISYSANPEKLPEIYGVINLAGESLFGYWTKKKKENIINSRLTITAQLLEFIEKLPKKPEVFINGSAVGFYGTSHEHIFTESTSNSGDDFLASVAVKWEKAAKRAEDLGIRTVYSRFGIVLGRKNGALPLMELPVKLFVGGKVGDGEQWISWIHVGDAVHLMELCLFNEFINGPVNFTAPKPLRNKEFYQALAAANKRPYWFPTPAPFINLVLGEMSILITEGQYVLPQKALDQGFNFTFPNLKTALNSLK